MVAGNKLWASRSCWEPRIVKVEGRGSLGGGARADARKKRAHVLGHTAGVRPRLQQRGGGVRRAEVGDLCGIVTAPPSSLASLSSPR